MSDEMDCSTAGGNPTSIHGSTPTPQHPLRVLLVEDDSTTARRLMNELAIDGRAVVTHWAATVSEATEAIDAGGIDVALVDLGLPDGSGLSVIEYIRRVAPAVDALVLSVFGSAANMIDAIRAGASGYLLKSQADPREIVDGIVDTTQGASSISPAIARQLLDVFRTMDQQTAVVDADSRCAARTHRQRPTSNAVFEDEAVLTPRECEMLQWVAKGRTVKEIARDSRLSPHTVSTHVKNIYRKLHVGSRGEAVYVAQRNGLI